MRLCRQMVASGLSHNPGFFTQPRKTGPLVGIYAADFFFEWSKNFHAVFPEKMCPLFIYTKAFKGEQVPLPQD
jgi:hypothetical protein